mmetsp:Transcript_741/g.1963  ORF Transcript_741/g.1963 Transcript_741/m.1963 type:complete len:236 (+) Transcript_741:190-897(+)
MDRLRPLRRKKLPKMPQCTRRATQSANGKRKRKRRTHQRQARMQAQKHTTTTRKNERTNLRRLRRRWLQRVPSSSSKQNQTWTPSNCRLSSTTLLTTNRTDHLHCPRRSTIKRSEQTCTPPYDCSARLSRRRTACRSCRAPRRTGATTTTSIGSRCALSLREASRRATHKGEKMAHPRFPLTSRSSCARQTSTPQVQRARCRACSFHTARREREMRGSITTRNRRRRRRARYPAQ